MRILGIGFENQFLGICIGIENKKLNRPITRKYLVQLVRQVQPGRWSGPWNKYRIKRHGL